MKATLKNQKDKTIIIDADLHRKMKMLAAKEQT